VGHPNPETQKLAKRCNIRLINMQGPVFDRLVRNSNYYHMTEIPGGIYKGNPNKISTFSMHTGLVTRLDVDKDLVYALTSVLVDHLDALRARHPIFNQVELAEMTHDLALPLHPGSAQFFKKRL
jgi:TRAP transporter TAXI family solute receptor